MRNQFLVHIGTLCGLRRGVQIHLATKYSMTARPQLGSLERRPEPDIYLGSVLSRIPASAASRLLLMTSVSSLLHASHLTKIRHDIS